jgi:NAD(P)-dependent dehydrogenase (short-subunit alcohol dehydrogenase family)
MSNRIDLDGRCAIVTGGAQGIGRSIAERFLASGAGVAIWDRDSRLGEETAAALKGGGRAVAFTVDVADYASVECARDATLATFARIDILVNNAGIGGQRGSIRSMPGGRSWRSTWMARSTAVAPSSRTWSPTPTAASSTSPRSPARRAIRGPPPIPPPRPVSWP